MPIARLVVGQGVGLVVAGLGLGGPIETGHDLAEWVDASEGKGLGLRQKGP